MLNMLTYEEILAAVAALLLSYLVIEKWKDPLRRIPGPTPLPIVGNAFMLMINAKRMHMQFYELAKQYGPVMKLIIFNEPVVVLNSIDVCLEAKLHRGGDFLGKPPLPRYNYIVKPAVADMSFDDPVYPILRHATTSGLRAYGTGMAQLENTILDVLQDITEDLNIKTSKPISSHHLINGFVSSVMAFLIYGDSFSYENKIFEDIHDMNQRLMASAHPTMNHPELDLFPSLFKFRKYLFRDTSRFLEESKKIVSDLITSHVIEFKDTFDRDNLRGCLDYFIKVQQEELDSNGNPILDDAHIVGLMANFTLAGSETSFCSLSQALLDFVHDKELVKQIQAEIDAKFEPGQVIKHSDRDKLPLLEAYVYENLRYLSQLPILLPNVALRDTEVGGYKIPKGTRVVTNAFNTAHNPDVYPEPFEFRPSRFLDNEGKIVPPDHSARHNFIGFGAGARHCPGESFARTRIFLFLAHILQKFDIKETGDLPNRDVRGYDMGFVILPPSVDLQFTLRQCVD